MAPGSNPHVYDLFTALAHPLRRRILRELVDRSEEACPAQLAEQFGEDLSMVSYHVRVLARCGAVELVRTERERGATRRFYRPIVTAGWALSALQAGETRLG